MKRHHFTHRFPTLLMLTLGLAGLTACSNEPDGEDLYTFTGKTINDYITEDADLTSFEYILQRIDLDKSLAAYGQYTCFAPSNAGVAAYIDSLWNDTESRFPHNGLSSNSLEGLNDSLCKDIAKYHMLNGEYTVVNLAQSSGSVNTMLGYTLSTEVIDGYTTLNKVARIISADHEAVNGIFHKIDKVAPRSSRLIGDEFDHIEGYTIFNQALKLTGIDQLLTQAEKNVEYTINDIYDVSASDGTKTNPLYWPEECKVGYTIFAESDAVMKSKANINSLQDLINYANEQYENASDWYDYIREKGITVSTGTDYTNQWNALNMFVRYHILYAKMAKDQFVFESGSNAYWNYNTTLCGGEPYDYYETMLPHTILKIWEPQAAGTSTDGLSKRLYINRYRPNNTLTDEVGTLGSAGMHGTIRENIRINTSLNRQAHNGYIHAITDMLVYDQRVKTEVLHERLRFEATTFLPEFINNGFRNMSYADVSALNGGGSGARVAFPLNYFDNVYCYNDQNKLRYNVKGAFRSYQADAFQGWGNYDLAIKLPPVPTGTYELRLVYSPMGHGGFMQFYLGTSTDLASMQILGIPLDVRIDATDERIGWTDAATEEDRGIESDRALRNRGYMRGPFSFRGHADSFVEAIDGVGNCRTDGTVILRKILVTQQFKQSEEYWLRFKNMLSNGDALKWQMDFIEFVPIDVLNNGVYEEDWM